MPIATVRDRPGPKPRFSTAQVVNVAVAIVEDRGFAALSLRAVARELDVTPHALYSYVRSGDELIERAIDRLIEQQVNDVVWPHDWRAALRLLATGLSGLVQEHPAMIEAYSFGVVRTPRALDIAEGVLSRLVAGGLPPDVALSAYGAVHALVIGHALLTAPSRAMHAAPHPALDPAVHPTLAVISAAHGGFAEMALAPQVEALIRGVEAQLAESNP